ncbi:MAG: carboxypeptidase-like regulatory domain-containing protein [Pyrinomonadaceae bacterium]|nr:carboxypeptidase-like regulatory domain-containing protein [Pyrinomonadaceae bacterium]MCX7640835.1 carboxypeptidase-like regulatory domain-containing protein [Pyrinomonadaceae bacterium]MDW8303400.1 carboxypeptidase-like regulatory domain-containing protein [Acidobacteriota bacterium]
MKAFLLILVCCVGLFAQETGSVKGKVRTSEGKPLTNITVSAHQKEKEVKSVKTNSKGEFLMEGLPAGKYNFVFTGKGYSTGIKYNVEVRAGKLTDLGDRLILDVDRGTLVIIMGSVFNQDGLSVAGAKVEIERIIKDGSVKRVGSSFTNESGEFAFRFPEEPAKYRITASKDRVSASREIEVEMAAVYRLSLILKLK